MAAAVAGMVGLVIGSFLNVVIHRVPLGISLVRPPSSCPSCGTRIRPRDNVPLASWIMLGGRCRSCGARIPVRYPLVELATAVAFAGAFLRYHRPVEAAFVAAADAVLLALAVIDLQHRRVPNVIVLPATAAGGAWIVAMGLALGRPRAVMSSMGSAAAGFVLLLVIAVVSGGMGFGDVKLAALVGLTSGWFGWAAFVLALFSGFILGGMVGIVLLATGRRGRKDAIPFAPMLCAGAVLAMFVGGGPVRVWLKT